MSLAPAASAAPPQLDIDWSPGTPRPDQTVTFTGKVDRGLVTLWEWDLNGDGEFQERTGKVVTYSYAAPADVRIRLHAVVDGEDRYHDGTIKIRQPSPNAPPDASFVFFPAAPVAGQPVTFVSTAVDPDSAIPSSAQRWDLNGDGIYDEATGASATVTFPTPGVYPVSLQVTTNARDVASLMLPVDAPAAGSGVRVFSLMSPFPVVRIAGRTTRRGARIRRLTVDAPPGTSLKVRCAGRGCPFRRLNQTVSTKASGSLLPSTRLTRVRRLEGRTLRKGALLRVFVTRADAIGKYTRFRIRRGKPPARQDLCLVPGNPAPVPCPAG